MTNLLARLSSTTHENRVLMTAVVLGVQMLLPGCGIPPVQQADPGRGLPVRFGDANNLEYLQQNPSMGTPDGSYPMDATRRGGIDDADFLASLRQPESWLALNDAPQTSEGTTIQARFVDAANWTPPEQRRTANPTGTILASYSESTAGIELVDDAAAGPAAPQLLNAPPNGDGMAPGADGMAPGADGAAPNADEEMFHTEAGLDSWESSAQLPWNEFFDDPYLLSLIDQALVGNQELKILTQDVRIASLQVLARSGAYLPFVTWGAGAAVDKPGQFTRAGAVEDQLMVKPGRGFPEPLPDFMVAANLSWEIDIWRKLRNARDAASLRFLSTRDGQTYVVTRLVAEIAENYYELMMLDARLEILDQTIAIQQRSQMVAEAQKAAGTGTELGVQRFLAEVRKNQSEKLIIHQNIIEIENRINYLCGRFPQHVERSSGDYLDLTLHALSTGVPSQLLQNRPDIRQAERALEAAGLDVQVARADFFPDVVVTSGVGYDAFNAKYLFSTPESLIYNVAGDLVAPLINKRAIRAEYLSANAEQLQTIYKYQQTVINAFTEVINRMAKVQNYRQSVEVKRRQVAALRASVDVASNLFDAAQAQYVDVLLAQRDLMEARTVLVETKQQQLSAVINAYQALGGGGVLFNFEQ